MVAGSYLAGAFPTAGLVARAFGRDIHHEGSGNPGATNTYRVAGAVPAALVMTVDVAKGALATGAGKRAGNRAGRPAGPHPALGPACGVAAVLGHCFPPWNPRAGGKGVATAGGMLLALNPPLAVLAGAAWATIAKATRRVSLASIVTAVTLPLAAKRRRRPRAEQIALAAVAAIIVVRHRDNIARLRRGEERPLGPQMAGER
jgi:glycerol-3-phosphate acyltransferase PlsY